MPEEKPKTESGSEEPSNTLFFNVMPKAAVNTPEITSTTSHSPKGLGSGFISLLKILGIILVIAACGVGGYFGYSAWEKRKTASPLATPSVTDSPTPTETSFVETTTNKEWLKQYFNQETCTDVSLCGDNSDPDKDGLGNKEEEQHKTDPTKPDSDSDGLADGDEVNIFGGDPTNIRSAGNAAYTDSDDAKGGFDTTNKGEKMTAEKLAEISEKVKKFGFHEPTVSTLGDALSKYINSTPPPQVPNNVDQSAESKLARDTDRLNTVKKIGIALFKFKTDNGLYPLATDWPEMVNKVKIYNTVATNTTDPINVAPYVYSYAPVSGGQDFSLSYFSETQNQVIKYTGVNAAKDANNQEADLNDDQRIRAVESIRQALLIYSAANVAGSQTFVFPTQEKHETDLVPQYLDSLPKDPKTKRNYEYTVSQTFDSFTVKTPLENPPQGKIGYQCTQEECDNY